MEGEEEGGGACDAAQAMLHAFAETDADGFTTKNCNKKTEESDATTVTLLRLPRLARPLGDQEPMCTLEPLIGSNSEADPELNLKSSCSSNGVVMRGRENTLSEHAKAFTRYILGYTLRNH